MTFVSEVLVGCVQFHQLIKVGREYLTLVLSHVSNHACGVCNGVQHVRAFLVHVCIKSDIICTVCSVCELLIR